MIFLITLSYCYNMILSYLIQIYVAGIAHQLHFPIDGHNNFNQVTTADNFKYASKMKTFISM